MQGESLYRLFRRFVINRRMLLCAVKSAGFQGYFIFFFFFKFVDVF